MGLAPILVERIYETIAEINKQGTTILLVEQNANYALEVSGRGYVLETGTIAVADKSANLRENPDVQKAYLGACHRDRRHRSEGAVPALRAGSVGDRCSWLSDRKGYGERPGLAAGLLLSVVGGILLWLVWPAKPDSRWKVQGPLPFGGKDKTVAEARAERSTPGD